MLYEDALPLDPARKAGPDDPKHPGWPAGTPGGLGGKFRPKGGEEPVIPDEVKQRILGRLARRKARQLILSILRLGVEGLVGGAPGGEGIGVVAMMGELATMSAENRQNATDLKAATEFLNTRPHTLEELQQAATKPSQPGYEDHHIVTQGGKNAENISQDDLQSPKNIVRIPTLVHEDINGEYSKSVVGKKGMTVYQELQTKPFEVQFDEGVKIMRDMKLVQ